MALTKDDLLAIKRLFGESFDEHVPRIIDERVPKIIDERVPKIIDERVPGIVSRAIDQLKLEIGQFSLETTKRFETLEAKLSVKIDTLGAKLSDKIDHLSEKLEETTDMADTNRIEIAKIKRKIGMA